ncbi:uncharacterized protein EI90DRAFT_907563 [Cantharellus anzutake]|uniref:uncharacterized protein n=1 Tax=Cantharellus anzutake TaxID=1750568 RepID=UPI00190594FC|nr:uncharacterized protein EI90DRAFT_907563 [Cantharellus anzutake]KAF8331970.1 hypothetical protein EI90DRAFT_907563 [Cantharellus anzutake]
MGCVKFVISVSGTCQRSRGRHRSCVTKHADFYMGVPPKSVPDPSTRASSQRISGFTYCVVSTEHIHQYLFKNCGDRPAVSLLVVSQWLFRRQQPTLTSNRLYERHSSNTTSRILMKSRSEMHSGGSSAASLGLLSGPTVSAASVRSRAIW